MIRQDKQELAHWISSQPWSFFARSIVTYDDVIARIEDGDYFGEYELNFWVQVDEEKVGLIEIYELDSEAPMFSLRISSSYRGKGYGKKALNWLTQYIFENYSKIYRIEGQTREDNVPMRSLFNRCGYVKEAYYREAYPEFEGQRLASVAYGITRGDWIKGSRTPVPWSADSFFQGDQ